MTTDDEFFIVDVRHGWTNVARHPFITFWGPDNSGYTYSLDRAGRYVPAKLVPGYHYKHVYGSLRALERFPVPRTIIEAIAGPVPENMRQMWRDVVGPVVINGGETRTLLRNSRVRIGDPSAFDKRKEAA